MASTFRISQSSLDSLAADGFTVTVNDGPVTPTAAYGGGAVFKFTNTRNILSFLVPWRTSSNNVGVPPKSATISSDQKTATYTVDSNTRYSYQTFTYTLGEGEAVGNPLYTFTTDDVANCLSNNVTLKIGDVEVIEGTIFTDIDTLIANCAEGKKFFNTPNGSGGYNTSINFYGWNPSEGENMTVNMVLSNNDTVATLYPVSGMTFSRFEVNTQSSAIALAWVNHPSSGSANIDVSFSWAGGDLSSGNYNVVVTKAGVEIDNLTTANTSYTLNQAAGDYIVTVYDKGGKTDPTAANVSQAITLAAVLPKALYTFSAADMALLVANDTALTIGGVPAAEGSIVRVGDVLEATVTGNRVFYNETVGGETVCSINFYIFDNVESEMKHLNFTLSDEDKKATFTAIDNGNSTYGVGTFKCATKIVTPAVVGTNNVYRITADALATVNKERFSTIIGSDTPYDYGQFILSVLQFPFDIPTDIIGGISAIQLADKELTATGDKLLADRIKIDLGEITVPDTYGNMLSYANTNAVIHLPLTPSIVLDLEYVIGQTLGVYYLLDCYTGTATINITSTKLAAVISSTQVNIGVRVPYMADSYTAPENTGVVAGGNNGVKIPYIELISHDAILPNGFFTVPVVDETLISGQTGYIKVDNVELVTGALGNEKAQIISLLNSGVIIK